MLLRFYYQSAAEDETRTSYEVGVTSTLISLPVYEIK